MKKLSVLLCGLLLGMPVFAQDEEEDRDPYYLYGGVDYADLEVSFSDEASQTAFGCVDCGSRFYRGRIGTRLFKVIGVEAHYGQADDKGDAPGEVEVDQYYGIFIVPTGRFLDFFEISVPLGYSALTLARGDVSQDFNRVAFGMNVEVPIIFENKWTPEIRVGGGGMVYQAENHARVYGFHAGLRVDFKI